MSSKCDVHCERGDIRQKYSREKNGMTNKITATTTTIQ